MNLVSHLITSDELSPRRMTRDYDRFEIWKILFACQLAHDLVHEVVRSEFWIVRGHAARTPTVAPAWPIHFIRRQSIATSSAIIRGQPRRDNNRVFECVCEERRRQAGAKIIVSVATLSVDDDQRSHNFV